MDGREEYASFATHLNSKKAGPLVCPICKATESFEATGTLTGPPSDPLTPAQSPTSTDPLASAEPRFNYATCTNCGYSIFFDAGMVHFPE
jgi:predicted nucleic-acid-binding Zn-ribbon protein